MFTGIITNTGKLESYEKGNFIVSVDSKFVSKTKPGDSMAVNGVCLTVEKKKKDKLFFFVMFETIKRTNLSGLKVGSMLNLEKPITARTFLSGHLVQGHVDGQGEVKKIEIKDQSREVEIKPTPTILKFLVAKGSVTLNGISLTIAKLNKNSLVVGIIPHTWQNTNLKEIKIGNKVNIEIDIIAKYVKKFLN